MSHELTQPELPFDQPVDASWEHELAERQETAALRLWEQGQGPHPNTLVPQAEETISTAEQFKDRFDWVPHKRVEMSRAVKGLRQEIDEKSQHATIGAVGIVLVETEGYVHQASVDQYALEAALIDREDPTTFDAGAARSSGQLLETLAKHQLFASSLVGESWPASYQPARLKPKLAAIKADIQASSDEQLQALWGGALSSAQERAKFWSEQIASVKEHPRVQEFRAEQSQRARQR
jgi:hypothetical protein